MHIALRERDGETFLTGASIRLSGFAFDPEDSYLEGEALTWRVVGQGNVGTGEEALVQDLPAGQHTVVLSAVDSDFSIGSDAVQIEIVDPRLLYLPILTAGL